MGKRLDRTLKNWRWWLLVPVMTPLIIVYALVVGAIGTICELVASMCGFLLKFARECVLRPMFNFIYAKHH